MDHLLNGLGNGELPSLALVGGSGYNAQTRVLPELERFADRLRVVCYDLRPPARTFHGIPFVLLRDAAELGPRLTEQRPDTVLIETTDADHVRHILLALGCGARRVLCEKCLAAHPDEAARLLPAVTAARPGQEVFVIDHYALLNLWLTLLANGPRWLGRVTRLEVTLFEAQGVPPHQEKSHADGVANFFHHVVALGGSVFDLADLEPAEAAWARHPEAGVPDTFRAARFRSRRTGAVVLEGAVGKYVAAPRKQIVVEGTHGRACLDRDRAELRVVRAGVPGVSVLRAEADTGYGELAQALATGAPLPALLSVEQAAQALRLVDQAHGMARELPVYPDGRGADFVCDWALHRSPPAEGWRNSPALIPQSLSAPDSEFHRHAPPRKARPGLGGRPHGTTP
jgi:predicted dehydrogenase